MLVSLGGIRSRLLLGITEFMRLQQKKADAIHFKTPVTTWLCLEPMCTPTDHSMAAMLREADYLLYHSQSM